MNSGPDSSNVNFSIGTELQHARLIELPPDLLDAITSEEPAILQLKSSNGLSEGNVLLCSQSQTYEVRQVQSSNTLYITETEGSIGEDAAATTICGVAQPRGMLELTLALPDAIGYLRHVVPVLETTAEENALSSRANEVQQGRSLASIRGSAPFSLSEFEAAWRELCGFELNGNPWLPAAGLLAATWRSLLSTATIRGINLTRAFEASLLDISIEEANLPKGLLYSMLSRLDAGKSTTCTINKDKCVSWVGDILLQSHGQHGAERERFLHDWQDSLPEQWRTCAELGKIEGKYYITDQDLVLSRSTQDKSSIMPMPVATKPLSKWHERLKATRRQ